ncbi:hypothetical protein CBS470a_008849, partial [Colletotrichum nupharicola]
MAVAEIDDAKPFSRLDMVDDSHAKNTSVEVETGFEIVDQERDVIHRVGGGCMVWGNILA